MRRFVPLALTCALGLGLPGRVATAASVFDLADQSDVVAVGTVAKTAVAEGGKLEVFTVEPARVLKGGALDGELMLVQEMLFPTTKPYFATGTRTLVFAVPLPNYTSYREALGEGTYWRWTERLDTAADVATLSDPAMIEPLVTYLTVRDDPAATARHLGTLLASPVPRLRADALATLEERDALMPLLDAEALAPLAAFLADPRIPPTVRAAPLVHLARHGAAGIGAIAEKIAASGGPLEAAAVDALVSVGKPPDEARLLAYSRRDDPALRIAAVRGLAQDGSPAALDRLEAILAADPASEVRVATLQALGGVTSDRAVALLAKALHEDDKERINAAAESLGRIGSPAAIAALADVLEHGTLDAQTAAAFALKRSGKWQAVEVLEDQAEHHPDARVRKIANVALGKESHEH